MYTRIQRNEWFQDIEHKNNRKHFTNDVLEFWYLELQIFTFIISLVNKSWFELVELAWMFINKRLPLIFIQSLQRIYSEPICSKK